MCEILTALMFVKFVKTFSFSPSKDLYKRYFIINQQIARHFVQYSECLYHPLPFYVTPIINSFLTSGITANHDKGLGF